MKPPTPSGAEGGAAPARTVLLAWLLLTVLTGTLYFRAERGGPPGYRFVGTFYFVGDFYNYLSYVQQAEDGAFLLRNKLGPSDQAAVLVNLEWWLVGRLSALLGRHPVLAYRVFGAAASLAFVALTTLWLNRLGLPPSCRAPALLLVFGGGGLGGLLFGLGRLDRPPLDLRIGYFPFVEVLSNPHFVAGTVLLMAALLAFMLRRPALGVLLGTALGLVRPYDLGLLLAVRGLAVLLTEPPAAWLRRLTPLLGLLPVLGYNAWVFFGNDAYRIFSSSQYRETLPPLFDLAIALGPATILAMSGLLPPDRDPEIRRARVHFVLWVVVALGLLIARPLSFSQQFSAGIGLPLLALAAAGLARGGAKSILLAAIALSPTALLAAWIFQQDSLDWFVPAPRLETARLLAEDCRPGEVVFAPPDIGLYVGGLTACWPYVSHAFAPDHARKEALTRTFYTEGDAAQRASLLERICPKRVVVFPGQEGVSPEWLDDAPYETTRRVGAGPWAVEVRTRREDRPCSFPGPP
jgi:hypothetical protein